MTIGELKNSAYSLAHLSGDDADILFKNSLPGVLLSIYSDLNITARKSLYINNITPVTHISKLIHRSGETKTLPLSGRAYTMRLSGKGTLKIKDGYQTERIDFDTGGRRIFGFIKTGGEIELSGDYLFTVYDFAVFSEITSDRAEDIPDFGKEKCISFSESENFLAFLSLPTDEKGRAVPGVYYEGERLYLPWNFEGFINLHYLKKPRVHLFDEAEKVDIPSAYEVLILPLLLSRMLTEEDADISKAYNDTYTALLKELKKIPKDGCSEYVITDGWA